MSNDFSSCPLFLGGLTAQHWCDLVGRLAVEIGIHRDYGRFRVGDDEGTTSFLQKPAFPRTNSGGFLAGQPKPLFEDIAERVCQHTFELCKPVGEMPGTAVSVRAHLWHCKDWSAKAS